MSQFAVNAIGSVVPVFSAGAGAGGASQLPTNYIDGLTVAWLTAATVSIAPGRARDSTDAADMISSATITPVDITVAGPAANGRDSAVALVAGWYYLYLITDSGAVNPPAGLFSASAAAPAAFPAGYDTARRIASVFNTTPAVGSLRRFVMTGRAGTLAFYEWWDTQANVQILAFGASVGVYAPVVYTTLAPPTAQMVDIGMEYVTTAPGLGSADIQPSTFGSAATFLPWVIVTGPTESHANKRERLLSDGTLLYQVSTGDSFLQLWVDGYVDDYRV